MKVLIIGKYYTEGFALHVAEALAAMGHDVRRFEPGLRSSSAPWPPVRLLKQARQMIHSATDNLPRIREMRIRALWQAVDVGPLDVVLVCHDFLWPREVEELKRRTNAQVAMWFPDSLAGFGRGLFMNAPYDGLFFKDPYIIQALGDVLRSPTYYLPECFSPERHWLPDDAVGSDAAYQCDIATAGNQHSWRVAFFKNLTSYDVKLWGNPASLWMAAGAVAKMHQGRVVYNHDKVRAFRGAKIVVNNLLYGEIWGVNARTFEAAGAGAFQLVDWRPGLGQLFEDGKELVSFRGIADLKQKIDFWLPRATERHEIAAAGMRRAHHEHTYALRLRLLLDTLAGSRHGYSMPQIG